MFVLKRGLNKDGFPGVDLMQSTVIMGIMMLDGITREQKRFYGTFQKS